MLNAESLLADFIAHVDAMSDDEVIASIQHAYHLTSGCAHEVGDIEEYIDLNCNETLSESISNTNIKCLDYMFVSSNVASSFKSAEIWFYEEDPAA